MFSIRVGLHIIIVCRPMNNPDKMQTSVITRILNYSLYKTVDDDWLLDYADAQHDIDQRLEIGLLRSVPAIRGQ